MFGSFFAAATSSKSAVFASAAATSWISRALYSSSSSSTTSASSQENEQQIAFCASNDNKTPDPIDFSTSPISEETIRSGKTWGIPWDAEWDSVKPSQGANKNIKRQILLIRHGQYKNERRGCEDSERVLTEKGELQAQLTGAFLRKAIRKAEDDTAGELFVSRNVKTFTSSNMTRAMQTCEFIIDAYDIGMKKWWTIDAGLAERFPCDPQPAYPKKAKADCHRVVEGSFKKFIHRPKAGNTEHTIDVIVCHGNIIRYFLCRALQIPPEAWLRISLPHCSITSISIRGNGNVSVNQVGSVGHLPVNLQTVSNVE